MPTTKPAPLRIAYPFPQIPYTERKHIRSSIDPKIKNYIFHRILPESGHEAALVAQFIKKLYDECLRRGIGIPVGKDHDPVNAIWDEDNEAKVAQVMEDMNFNAVKLKKVKS